MLNRTTAVAGLLCFCGLGACSDLGSSDAGLDGGLDAVERDAGPSVLEVAPPQTGCGSVSLLLDVQNGARVTGLPESAFTYQLYDGVSGVPIAAQNTCFAEVAPDVGPPGYSFCFAQLPSTTSFVLAVHVVTSGGAADVRVGFSVECSGDAGAD